MGWPAPWSARLTLLRVAERLQGLLLRVGELGGSAAAAGACCARAAARRRPATRSACAAPGCSAIRLRVSPGSIATSNSSLGREPARIARIRVDQLPVHGAQRRAARCPRGPPRRGACDPSRRRAATSRARSQIDALHRRRDRDAGAREQRGRDVDLTREVSASDARRARHRSLRPLDRAAARGSARRRA